MRINKYMKNNMQHLRLEECNIYAEIDTNSIPMEVPNDEDLIDLLVEFLPVESGKEILEYRLLNKRYYNLSVKRYEEFKYQWMQDVLGKENLEKIEHGRTSPDVVDYDLCDVGAIAIGEALKINTSVYVNVSFNKIGDEGAKSIAKGLKTDNHLTQFYANNNNIGNDGAEALADALLHHTVLEEITLSRNNIGYDGARALLTGIKKNKKSPVKWLNLGYNSISQNDKKALRQEFEGVVEELFL